MDCILCHQVLKRLLKVPFLALKQPVQIRNSSNKQTKIGIAKHLVDKIFTTKFKFFKILCLNFLLRDFLGLGNIVFLKIKLIFKMEVSLTSVRWHIFC